MIRKPFLLSLVALGAGSACVPIFGDFGFGGASSTSSATGGAGGHGGAGTTTGSTTTGSTDTGSTSTTTGSTDTGSATTGSTSTGSTSSTACTQCPGGCFDLETDSANCGACAHDCLGGDCQAGACQPVVIASGQSQPGVIAVGAGSVFWINGTGAVMRVPVAGGNPTVVGTGASSPAYLVLDTARVYWTTMTAIESAPVGGTGGSQVVSLGQWYPWGLAGDGTYLFWLNSHNEIRRVKVDGTGETVLATVSPIRDTIGVDANNVYWIDATEVRSISKSGGSAHTVIASSAACSKGCTWPVVVSGGTIYLQALGMQVPGNYEIKRVTPDGTSVVDLGVSETSKIQGIAVDGGDVFLANGALLRTPAAGGGAATKLVPAGVTRVAVDQKAVYWTDVSGGTVSRLAR